MKKTVSIPVVAGLLCCATMFGLSCTTQSAEQKVQTVKEQMRERAAWMTSMNASLVAGNFEQIRNDAQALASQTGAAATTLKAPLAKELTVKLSSLASAVAEAAGKNDAETVKAKLSDIKATCGECHAKFR